jgi:hypothetical protein
MTSLKVIISNAPFCASCLLYFEREDLLFKIKAHRTSFHVPGLADAIGWRSATTIWKILKLAFVQIGVNKRYIPRSPNFRVMICATGPELESVI